MNFCFGIGNALAASALLRGLALDCFIFLVLYSWFYIPGFVFLVLYSKFHITGFIFQALYSRIGNALAASALLRGLAWDCFIFLVLYSWLCIPGFQISDFRIQIADFRCQIS